MVTIIIGDPVGSASTQGRLAYSASDDAHMSYQEMARSPLASRSRVLSALVAKASAGVLVRHRGYVSMCCGVPAAHVRGWLG